MNAWQPGKPHISVQKTSTAPTGQKQIVVRLHRAFGPPDLACMAIRSLECTSQVFFMGGPLGLRAKHETHRFYRRDADGYIGFRAGLVPRVISDLQRAGIEAHVDDRSRWPVLELAARHLSGVVTDENRSLLNAVVASPRGCIAVKHFRDMRARLRDLIRLFRDHRVLVVCLNRGERDRLGGDLSASLKCLVSTHHGISWGSPDRVTVITADFFAGVSRVNVDFDVIVFTHPKSVTGDQASETAGQLNNELLYCMVPPSYRPDKLTQLQLEAICGPVICDDVESDSAVQVVILETASFPFPRKLKPLERKRATIWKNDQRNESIAEFALTVAGPDFKTFPGRGVFLNQHIDLLSQHPNPGIAILVESIEHARELQRRLPGWTLQTAIPDQDGILDGGTCHRSIVTEAFASQGIHADIVIRATGTGAPLMVRGFPSVGQRRAFVLFDLADDFDAQANRDTQERIHDYQSRGWVVSAGNGGITIQGAEIEYPRQCGRGA